jgi:hypothetical protein
VPRLLVGDQRFEGMGPHAMTRADFVDIVVECSAELFPGYTVVLFDRPHVYEQEEAVPALVLLRDDLGAWFVVVVEVGDDLDNAVLPAVSILRRTRYGILDAELIIERSELDEDAVIRLTREEQPEVLVIASTVRPDWRVPLQAEDAIVTFLEVFEAADGARIIRVNGEQPVAVGSVLCTCHINSASPRLVVVPDPSPLGEDVEFLIDYDGGVARWHRMDTGSGTVLYSANTNRLPHDTEIELIQIGNGRLQFRLATEGM